MPPNSGKRGEQAGKRSGIAQPHRMREGKNTKIYRRDATVRITRLLRLLLYLRRYDDRRSISRSACAAECGCSLSTLSRELRFLCEEGFLESSRRGVYRVVEATLLAPLLSLTPDHLLGLGLARVFLSRPDIPLGAQMQGALDHLLKGVSPRLRELVQDATGEQRQRPGNPTKLGAPALTTLVEAWLSQQTISMDYESQASGRRRRHLDPYHITAEGSLWFVHGWCHNNKAIRTFALDRLHGAELLPQTFRRNAVAWAAFAETEGIFLGLRGGPPVLIRVRFAPEVATYALRPHRWPAGLTARREPDGSVLLTGTARGVDGILTEILRWRRHAQVEGGPELLAAVHAELDALNKIYSVEA